MDMISMDDINALETKPHDPYSSDALIALQNNDTEDIRPAAYTDDIRGPSIDIKEVLQSTGLAVDGEDPSQNYTTNGKDVSQNIPDESYVYADQDIKPIVVEILSIFPFICGICYDKFQDVQKYYTHIKGAHEEVEKYFHSHETESERETESRRGAGVYFCGKCSYVAPSICNLNNHLLGDENAAVYNYCAETKTAYPCSDYDASTVHNSQVRLQANLTVMGRSIDTTAAFGGATTASDVKVNDILEQQMDNNVVSNLFSNKQLDNKTKTKRNSKRNTKRVKRKDSNIKTPSNVSLEQLPKPNKKSVKDRKPRARVRKTNKTIKTEQAQKESTVKRENVSVSNKTEDGNLSESHGPENAIDYGSDTTIENDEFSESATAVKSKRKRKPSKTSKSASEKIRIPKKRTLSVQSQTLLPCHKCGMIVKRMYLRKHMLRHIETKNYNCDQCDMSFKCQNHLSAHQKTVHSEATFVCEHCGKGFRSRPYLRQHVKTHRDRLIQCPHCPKAFTYPQRLKKHLAVHNVVKTAHEDTYRDRLIQCPHCPKAFTYPQRLKKHLAVHNEEKQFKCPLCDKKFTFQQSIQVHIRQVHQDARPLSCDKCGATFKVRNGLRRHKKIHEPPEYACVICGKMFVVASNRRIHMKTHINRGEYDPVTNSPIIGQTNRQMNNQGEFDLERNSPIIGQGNSQTLSAESVSNTVGVNPLVQ